MNRTTQPIIRRMRGVTVRRGGGHWWVFTNHNGKRKVKAFPSKKKADAFARKVEKALKERDVEPGAA